MMLSKMEKHKVFTNLHQIVKEFFPNDKGEVMYLNEDEVKIIENERRNS